MSPIPKIFNELVVATINGAPVRVRDIGWAEDGTREQRSVARLNGVPTVTLEVQKADGSEHRRSHRRLQRRICARIESQLPSDVKMEVIRDQSRYIYAALHEINSAP